MNPRKLRIKLLDCWEHQYQAAAAFGIPESRLSKILRGREELRPEETARIEAVLAAKQAEAGK